MDAVLQELRELTKLCYEVKGQVLVIAETCRASKELSETHYATFNQAMRNVEVEIKMLTAEIKKLEKEEVQLSTMRKIMSYVARYGVPVSLTGAATLMYSGTNSHIAESLKLAASAGFNLC